jgi:hypothetical protein
MALLEADMRFLFGDSPRCCRKLQGAIDPEILRLSAVNDLFTHATVVKFARRSSEAVTAVTISRMTTAT